MRHMARVWSGRTIASLADSYHHYLEKTGVAALRSTPGCLGVWLMRRIEDGYAHFMIMSLWKSLESMRGFSDDPAKARYFPEDAAYLLEMPTDLDLFEVLEAPQVERDAQRADPGSPRSPRALGG